MIPFGALVELRFVVLSQFPPPIVVVLFGEITLVEFGKVTLE